MTGHILTLNAGSSSLKFALFADQDLAPLASGLLDGLGTDPNLVIRDAAGAKILVDRLEGEHFVDDHPAALARVLAALRTLFPAIEIVAIGHRVVHGGMDFARPLLIDPSVLDRLDSFSPLAPLHQPHNLAGIRAAMLAFPGAPQVACFDTAFHRTMPFVEETYALPRALYDEGVRRYGFHGLSYEFIAGRLAELAPDLAAGKVVVAHLGSGASLCALDAGRSRATSMGFSALDGIPMGTRPGQLDPGVLLYLMARKGMDQAALADLLYRQSGLKGLSGLSNDMRDLLASPDPHAAEAVAFFVHRIVREIASLAAALGGLDGIVFTAGIGENAAPIRQRVVNGLAWLGAELDEAANAAAAGTISSTASKIRVLVIPTNEELMIARHVRDRFRR